jgi:hypothetical protein
MCPLAIPRCLAQKPGNVPDPASANTLAYRQGRHRAETPLLPKWLCLKSAHTKRPFDERPRRRRQWSLWQES